MLDVLAGLVLFLAPGLVFLALLPQREREALAADESWFLAVAVGVASAAWVGLVLAEAGRFSLLTAAALTGAGALAAAVAGRRRLAFPLRRPSRWSAAVPAIVVLACAFALQCRPTEYLMGGRDPGTYVAAMALLARTGALTYVDPAVRAIPAEDRALFFRHPEREDYSWGRFMGFPLESPESGRVVPEFFHLFPAFGAYFFQTMGVKGALASPAVFGVLGTLAVCFAVRRILGPPAAFLGALLLATNVVQVWFGRYPVSEGMSQFLIFLGLVAFWHWEERGAPAFGALAGVALGLALLVRIDSALLVLPLGTFFLVRGLGGHVDWRRARWVVVPFGLLALHTAAHAAVWSRKYLLDIARRPYWRQPPIAFLAGMVLAVVLLVLARRYGPRVLRRLEDRAQAVRTAVMLAVVTLTAYAYFLRPALSAWAGGDGNDPSLSIAPWVPDEPLGDPAWLARAGFRRLAAHDAQSLLRLGWFVTPLGLALGLLGLLLLVRDWRPRYLLPVLTFGAYAGFYLYKIRVYNDYYFALRRFVPVVLPFLLAAAAFALVRLARGGGWRRALAGALAAFLLVVFLLQSLPVARHVDWKGSVRFVQDVARRFGPEDVVVFEQKESLHLLSLPLWAVHGVNALELARFDPDPEKVNHLVRAWRGRFRHIYFVYTYRTDLCGVFLQKVQDHAFATLEWERAYGRPPRGPSPRGFQFTVARAVLPEELQVPALSEVDVGGSDDVLVSGFYDKEGAGQRTYRWTGRCGSVYLPAARQGTSVEVTVSAGMRPAASPPAVVRVSLAGVELGFLPLSTGWTSRAFTVPAVPTGAAPVLRLDVVDPQRGRARTWRPANELPGSGDTRDLGVMVDRVRVGP